MECLSEQERNEARMKYKIIVALSGAAIAFPEQEEVVLEEPS